MPDGVLPDEGIGLQLECILSRSVAGISPWQLLFWVNDLVPDADTVYADLIEATWGGYSRVTLTRSSWQTPTVGGGCAHSQYGTEALVWYVTGGPTETNYGYAMIDPTTNKIQFIQRFDDADISPVSIGARVVLLPEYTLTSAACE